MCLGEGGGGLSPFSKKGANSKLPEKTNILGGSSKISFPEVFKHIFSRKVPILGGVRQF